MNTKFDIVIIGAGIAGLGAAVALADKGHRVTVLERHARLQTQGGAIGIGPSGSRVLEQYRLLERVYDLCGDMEYPINQRRWEDGSLLMSSSAQTNRQAYGFNGCRGKRSDFQLLLFQAAQERGVVVRFNCPVAIVDDEKPSVTLRDGDVLAGDLIVAADGINSAVRLAFNPDKRQLFSGMDDYMFTIPLVEVGKNPKLVPYGNSFNIWVGPEGCVVVGPCKTSDEGHLLFIEFVILGENIGREGNWQTEVDLDHVRRFFSKWDPALSELLACGERAHIWRLAYTEPDLDWTSKSGKVLLVGDAAHAVLPHTGVGATSSLEDGACLAECVARASTRSDIPRSTMAFEKIRKPRITYLQNEGIERAKSWHLPDGPEQEERDKRYQELKSAIPPTWDGKHIDAPPGPSQFALRGPYVSGYNTVEFTNRKLDELLG